MKKEPRKVLDFFAEQQLIFIKKRGIREQSFYLNLISIS